MTRLIDADALLEAIKADRFTYANEAIYFITNATTVQREHKYCGRKIDLAYGSTNCGSDFHGSIMKCDDCATETTVQREGWVSVPIEPTKEMIGAVDVLVGKETRSGGCYIDESESIEVYKAMLSAAPKE